MLSQQEQATVQGVSDAYVAAHKGIALWDRSNLYTSMALNYILISGFGEREACVRVIANNPCLEQRFSPMTAF